MNPIERALGILLLLSDNRLVTAASLAERFEVSLRTIYRDIERLAALGVPVEAERGAEGGYRLARGFLQPPVALTRMETAALLIAMAVTRGLKAPPLAGELDTAERKLLSSLPSGARSLLGDGLRLVGVEPAPDDIFHPELVVPEGGAGQAAVDGFMAGLVEGRRVRFRHTNPYRETTRVFEAEPYGILFDRNRWYLTGRAVERDAVLTWRADRIVEIEVVAMHFRPRPDFTIQDQLGRRWLERAMRSWVSEGPSTRIRITPGQAKRLRRDWYFGLAQFEAGPDGDVVMTIPDTDPAVVGPLVRWLGPGAEILSPPELRADLADTLRAMLEAHDRSGYSFSGIR